jgi:hypothetical protein
MSNAIAKKRSQPQTRVRGINLFRRARIGGTASGRRGPHWETSVWGRQIVLGSRKYLQPEPLMQEPTYVKAMALQGHSVPAYSYALNNPLHYTDESGLAPCMTTYDCCLQRNPDNPEMCGGEPKPRKTFPEIRQPDPDDSCGPNPGDCDGAYEICLGACKATKVGGWKKAACYSSCVVGRIICEANPGGA